MTEHKSPNILDLRPKEQPLKPGRKSLLRRSTQPYLQTPIRQKAKVNWRLVRREMGKYGLGLLIVLIPLGFGALALEMERQITTVVTDAEDGVAHALSGVASLGQKNVPEAQDSFDQAVTSLASATVAVEKKRDWLWGGVGKTPWVGSRLAASADALSAAEHVAKAMAILSQGLPDDGEWSGFSVATTGVITGSFGPLQPLAKKPELLDQAMGEILQAYDLITRLDLNDLPGSAKDKFSDMLAIVPKLFGTRDQAADLLAIVRDLLGTPDEREYLIVFQNNDEIRAVGGFPGTYLLVKFDRGTFTVTDAPGNGPYALRDHIGQGLLPPQPVSAIAPYWTFQDASWFADGPTSATAMLDFYQQARGFRPDGVILLTPQLVERLLAITGPLTLTDDAKTEVTGETFVPLIEEQVELKYDKEKNAPKEVLIQVVPELLNRFLKLTPEKNLLSLAVFLDECARSNILFLSDVPAVAQSATRLGWTAALGKETPGLVTIVRSNLGGGKTDRGMKETNRLVFTPDGDVWKVQLTLTRTHTGDPKSKLHGPPNKVFIRILTDPRATFVDLAGASVPEKSTFKTAPKGAVLSEFVTTQEGRILNDDATGLRITRESGYTTFGFWSIVPAGQTQSITLTYSIPRDATADLPVVLRKQPGVDNSTWEIIGPKSGYEATASAGDWKQREGLLYWSQPSTYSSRLLLKPILEKG